MRLFNRVRFFRRPRPRPGATVAVAVGAGGYRDRERRAVVVEHNVLDGGVVMVGALVERAGLEHLAHKALLHTLP